MTHTLHPEIEEHIQKIIIDIHSEILPGLEKYNVTLTKEDFDFIRGSIREHLGPYLHMPTDPKDNEPNGNSSVTHVKPENVSHAFDDISLPNSVSKDNEPLPENPSMYVGDEGGQRGAEVHKYNTVEEQKQSISKIEKIEPINEDTMGDRIPNKQTYFNKVDELVDGYNTLIDYINNTLPTSKDA